MRKQSAFSLVIGIQIGYNRFLVGNLLTSLNCEDILNFSHVK